jgi:nitrite reductase/ring-hydroxylating ferredoxin subunit
VDEFAPGDRRIIRIDGREIGVFRIDEDRFYAVRNRCPHQGGPLCLGRVTPRIVSERPGQYRLAEGAPLLACPWHGWHYDMATGQSSVGGDPNARSYPVSVEPGGVLREGPYVAETFAIRVEEEYVVVEV